MMIPDGEPDPDLLRIAARVEIHRIADLSRLDDLGLCVAAAVRRPFDPASITVCAGRGATWQEARTAAVAEAVERYCAEPRGRFATITTRLPLGAAIPVSQLVPATIPDDEAVIEWIAGSDVVHNTPIWVPCAAVFFPYRGPTWFSPATHGLAAGDSLADATRRALLECVERDAYTRAVALATVHRGRECPPVSADVLDDHARRCHGRALAAGLRVLLRDVTGGIGIPTVLATVAERTGDAVWAHLGCAADLDPRAAASRALTEAIQGRLVDIQGAREDLCVVRESPDPWFHDATDEPLQPPPPSIATDDPIAEIARRLVADGCGPAAVVDLSLEDVPFRVVRVVVPGLEVWAHDPARVGARLEAWCRAR
jgi:YcaO-like protein with predicted kinase domain